VVIDTPNKDSIGEIMVCGPNVTKGYFRDPDVTRAVMIRDGFPRTGDPGRLAWDGAMTLVGRLKEWIIHSGFNVYPPEVETVPTMHPDVALAAVVGRQCEGNEDVIAFVTTTAPVPLAICGNGASSAWQPTRFPLTSSRSTQCPRSQQAKS